MNVRVPSAVEDEVQQGKEHVPPVHSLGDVCCRVQIARANYGRSAIKNQIYYSGVKKIPQVFRSDLIKHCLTKKNPVYPVTVLIYRYGLCAVLTCKK